MTNHTTTTARAIHAARIAACAGERAGTDGITAMRRATLCGWATETTRYHAERAYALGGETATARAETAMTTRGRAGDALPTATVRVVLTADEASALMEVLEEEEATLATATADDDAEAKAMAATCCAISRVLDRMSGDGWRTLSVTLEEAKAIAEAVGDAGWVMGDVKADDAGSEEEAARSHAAAGTAYSVRNHQLAEAIAILAGEG